ncbi:MAG: VRR-NUC domain-containing protein [Thiomicrorhabdus sp.]|nr:VRR-NUC domain-containing protein [Thiomicrorhabdus sp.]
MAIAAKYKIKHECEAVQDSNTAFYCKRCELCKVVGDSYLDIKKKCKGWKFKEEIIEQKFVEYVVNDGSRSFKFEAAKGYPDQIVLIAPNYFFFIEFKRKGEQLKPMQVERHKELRSQGYAVYTTSNLAEAKQIYIKEKSNAAQVSGKGSTFYK